MELEVVVGSYTDQGPNKSQNEDTIAMFGWLSQSNSGRTMVVNQGLDTHAFLGVADGMGGHVGGRLASGLVMQHLQANDRRLIDESSIRKVLTESHDSLLDRMQVEPETAGMGTTIAGMLVHRHRALVFNVGDSRVYEWTGELLTQLSVDDAPMPVTGEPGRRITQAIGSNRPRGSNFEPHVRMVTLEPGSAFMICSDGLTDYVEIEALERVWRRGRSVEQLTCELAELAYEAPSQDNISVLVAAVRPLHREVSEPEAVQSHASEPEAATAHSTPIDGESTPSRSGARRGLRERLSRTKRAESSERGELEVPPSHPEQQTPKA